ncbi:MAG: acyl-CoA thioesterase/BAAT N-terminal domain-containing protein [Actinomycetota bacterium]
MGRKAVVGVVCVLTLGACTSEGSVSRQVQIEVDQPTALLDTPIHIRVTGLDPGERVRIDAQTHDAEGNAWESGGSFVADSDGEVDLSRDAPSSGSYRDADPMGLFWSVKRADGLRGYRFGFPHDGARVVLTVTGGNEVLARRTVVRLWLAEDVSYRRLRTRRHGIYGVYFAPGSTGSLQPAVLVFGGSEGGLGGWLPAALLASHGCPALAIAYFDAPGLRDELSRVPLEYFARALQWLSRQPGVDPTKLVVMGVSRGGEAALLVGANFPELVDGVVALVPSNVTVCGFPDRRSPAWTLGGVAVPCVRHFGPGWHGNPDAAIAVERIAAPILLVCGGRDQRWPSCPMSEAIQARLRAHDYPFPHVLLRYPRAGHGVGFPVPYLVGPSFEYFSRASREARARLWPEILEFLAQVASR